MNRRTFLKWTGATALMATVPLKASDITANEAEICNSKYLSCEPRWISFTEKMPELGRNIVSLCYFNNKASMNISIGQVLNPRVIGFGHWKPYPSSCAIELDMDYSEYYNKAGRIARTEMKMWNCDYPNGIMYNRLQQAHNFGWKTVFHGTELAMSHRHGTVWSPRHRLKEAPYVGRDATYWMYYDGIMEELPPLPEWKPPVIEYRDTLTGGSVGHGILIKD